MGLLPKEVLEGLEGASQESEFILSGLVGFSLAAEGRSEILMPTLLPKAVKSEPLRAETQVSIIFFKVPCVIQACSKDWEQLTESHCPHCGQLLPDGQQCLLKTHILDSEGKGLFNHRKLKAAMLLNTLYLLMPHLPKYNPLLRRKHVWINFHNQKK